MSSSSRLEPARRRALFLKVASTGAAVAGFVVLSVVARSANGSEPGQDATTASTNGALGVSARIARQAEQSNSFFRSGSVAPSRESEPPQAETRTS